MKNLFILICLMLMTKVSFATDLESNCVNLKEFGNLISVRMEVEQKGFQDSSIPMSGYFDVFLGKGCPWEGRDTEFGRIRFELEVFQFVNRVKIKRMWFDRYREPEVEYSLVNKVIDIALGMAKNIVFTYPAERLVFSQLVLQEAILGRNKYRFTFDEY